jgi:hypothetical protein
LREGKVPPEVLLGTVAAAITGEHAICMAGSGTANTEFPPI